MENEKMNGIFLSENARRAYLLKSLECSIFRFQYEIFSVEQKSVEEITEYANLVFRDKFVRMIEKSLTDRDIKTIEYFNRLENSVSFLFLSENDIKDLINIIVDRDDISDDFIEGVSYVLRMISDLTKKRLYK